MTSLQRDMGTQTSNWDGLGVLVFYLFPKLPTELRLKIWLATVDWKPVILPRKRISELEVCRESRDALLNIYEQCFHTLPSRQIYEICDALYLERFAYGALPPTISLYVNFATDVLYFDGQAMNGVSSPRINSGKLLDTLLVPEALAKLKHLATGYAEYHDPEFFTFKNPERIPTLGQFGNLTMISLMIPWCYARDGEEVTDSVLGRVVPPYGPHDLILPMMDPRYDTDMDRGVVGEVVVTQVVVVRDDGNNMTTFGSIEGTVARFKGMTSHLPDWKVPQVQNARMFHDVTL